MADTLAPVLLDVANLGFAWIEAADIDFRPHGEYTSDSNTRDWWRAWTGNRAEERPPLRFFATDCSGGVFALWERDTDSPVVYLGSEGELAVVARDVLSFVAILGGGADPSELALRQHDYARGRTPRGDDGAQRVATPEVIAIWRRGGGVGNPPDPEEVVAAAEPLRRELAAWVKATVR